MSDSRDGEPGSGLTKENFELLLSWLDPDADRAARKYEKIRHGLIRMFTSRGCADAESLADETIDRVALKLPGIKTRYESDPVRYLYGIANRVYQECLRREKLPGLPPPPASDEGAEEAERLSECLSECLERLSPANRDLILHYYEAEKQAKINARSELAAMLGVPANALRLRVHRIRSALHKCMEECVRAREG